MLSLQEKRQIYRRTLISEERRRTFEAGRRRLLEGQTTEDEQLIEQSRIEMMKLFDSEDELNCALQLYSEYEKDMEAEQTRWEEMEEESTKFQYMQEMKLREERRLFREEELEEKER